MQLTITIKLDNAAFYDDRTGDLDVGPEVARILHDYAKFASSCSRPPDMPLHDINGNKVGQARCK